MTLVLRAARSDDLAALYGMAKTTGGGFTNLPADRAKLEAKLDAAAAAFARDDDTPRADLFLFTLEDSTTGAVSGTCQIFARIGTEWPHYSFRRDAFSHYTMELGRSVRTEMLTFVTDHDGYSEVGGLYLHPGIRAKGAGALLARSRYLFMRRHRPRFADRTLAELRGVIDDTGSAPFWDGVAGRFFGMSFREADERKAVNGIQFIADLMPKHPIYIAMLTDAARAVLGVAHPSGRAAQRMLEREGFRHDKYIDVFDGGPTMTVATDQIATLRDACDAVVVGLGEGEGEGEREVLVATGRVAGFRAAEGRVTLVDDGVLLDPGTAHALGIGPGDSISYVAR